MKIIGLFSLFVMLSATLVVADVNSEQESDKAPNSLAPAPNVWLTLESAGGMPYGLESLTIDSKGTVIVSLTIPRENRYIGTFQMTLPPERLSSLRKLVASANIDQMKKKYPPPEKSYDFIWVTLAVTGPKGISQVYVTSMSSEYPSGLRKLFDVKDTIMKNGFHYPDGVLSKLLSETTNHPLSAIGISVQLPKHSFRVGEKIQPIIQIQNVGTEPVLLPSLETKHLAYGFFSVDLRKRPLRIPDPSVAPNEIRIDFGAYKGGPAKSLDETVKAELKDLVIIQPGKEWLIPMPKALVADSPGEYEIDANTEIVFLYEDSLFKKELGMTPISGMTFSEPVILTVSE